MFARLMNDNLEIIKDDKKIPIKGSVQGDKIYIMGGNILIEKGDIIKRIMSNGSIETFEVLNPNFYEQHGGISAHYQIKVINIKNKKALEHKNNDSNNIYNINVGGDNHGNIITGNNNTIVSEFDKKFDVLIQSINNSNIQDKEIIIQGLQKSKNDEKSFKKYLGTVLNKGAEIGSIISAVSELLSL